MDVTLGLLVIATGLNGILAGASLDQSIKQLPARHRIGAAAYSTYSQASDLGNGIVWYAVIGIGAALLTFGSAIVMLLQQINLAQALPVYVAAALSLLHSLVTTQAAPLLFSQRNTRGDPTALAQIFDRFARWQALRAALQTLTFFTLLWALVRYLQ